jgi:aspartate carbamoyltransferase catalytic subunit
MFGNTINLVSPEGLEMPPEVIEHLEDSGQFGVACHTPEEVIATTDILYVTRIQKERFPDPVEYKKVAGKYMIDPPLVSQGPEHMIVMHPLPRINEITPDVDAMPQAKYFIQAANGVPVRMALLSMVIGGV